MEKLKYAIIGTGGIGGYYGGMLARSGFDVNFLLRSDYEYVRQNGLQVDSVRGNFHVDNVKAYRSTSEMPVCDVIFVCLKTSDNGILPHILPSILGKSSRVVLIQNGIGVEREVQEMLPDVVLAAGVAYVCTSKVGPGHIHHQDLGKLIIAPFTEGGKIFADDAVLNQAVNDLTKAGVDASIDEYGGLRWKKSVWNIPFNGLTVVLNTTTDKLVANPESTELVRRLALEVIGAAKCCGFNLSKDMADATIELTRGMIPYSPSMKLDYDRRHKMEIKYLYTNAIEEATRHGADMPLTRMLAEQLSFIEAGYLNQG